MRNTKNKQVMLIVDDEKETRSVISEFLNIRYDGTFKEAKDGEEAVTYLKSNPCDLIILDIRMPKKAVWMLSKKPKRLILGWTY